MKSIIRWSSVSLLSFSVLSVSTAPLFGQESGKDKQIEEVQKQIQKLRTLYENRLEDLEKEVDRLRGEKKDSSLQKLRRKAAEFSEKKKKEQEVMDAAARLTGPGSIISSKFNEFNPRITVFSDFLGRLDGRRVNNDEGVDTTDRFSLREVEVDFRADIDTYAKGVLILAMEEHSPNEYEFKVEEGYLDLHTIPGLEDVAHNLRFKIGRFRTEFGIVNILHNHDLPWTSRPLPVIGFLGEEGDVENGLGIEYLVHNPWNEAITFNFQIVNGENSTLFAGANSNDLAFLGRLKWHKQLSLEHEFQFGASAYTGNAASDPPADTTRLSTLMGADFYYRWRPEKGGDQTSILFQTEAYLRHREENDRTRNRWGFYSALQHQFLKNFYAGARFDYLSGAPNSENDWHHKEAIYLSYYTSEFLRFRLGYEHEEENNGFDNDTLMFQVTWVFGSHAVEPYWVNR
ncbi:MAG: hypothetical protein QF752_17370 [Planctomycetota bacterium]|jgi:hypothetical protein|nr:hypothetical protein [Planctomycetota bacterium]